MAVRRGHRRLALYPELERFGYLAAGTPVVMMALSIPLAYLSPTLALLSWLLMIPAGWLIDRTASLRGQEEHRMAGLLSPAKRQDNCTVLGRGMRPRKG